MLFGRDRQTDGWQDRQKDGRIKQQQYPSALMATEGKNPSDENDCCY